MSDLIRAARVTHDRIERAMRIYEGGMIRQIDASTFVVASESSDKVFYIVNERGCTYPDAMERQFICKHIWACHVAAILTIWRMQLAESESEIEQIASCHFAYAPVGIMRTIQQERALALARLPLFPLGQTVATPGALEALKDAGQDASEFVARHRHGDWSEMSAEDKQVVHHCFCKFFGPVVG